MSAATDLKVVSDILARLLTNLNDAGQWSEDIADLQAIIDAPVEPEFDYGSHIINKNPDKFYFTSLNFVSVPLSQRPELIRFVVTKGDNVILNFQMDQSLRWIMKENADGDMEAACKLNLGNHRDGARAVLRKLAQAEIDHPGTFNEMINPKPAVVVKCKKSTQPASMINYIPTVKDESALPDPCDSENPDPNEVAV